MKLIELSIPNYFIVRSFMGASNTKMFLPYDAGRNIHTRVFPHSNVIHAYILL